MSEWSGSGWTLEDGVLTRTSTAGGPLSFYVVPVTPGDRVYAVVKWESEDPTATFLCGLTPFNNGAWEFDGSGGWDTPVWGKSRWFGGVYVPTRPVRTGEFVVPAGVSKVRLAAYTNKLTPPSAMRITYWSVTVMATKASDQVTLQVLPTPNNVRLYYLKQASNLAAPAKPTANPPASPWTATEPTYTEGSTDTVYTTMLTVWGDASYQYGDVQKSAAFEAAKQAFNKADSAATVAANLRTAIDLGLMRTGKASSPPAVGKGLTWVVLDEDTGTKVSGLRIANEAGTAWTPYQLIAEDLMVVGAGGTVRLKNGVVDADVILANDALYKKLATSEFWATLATVENLVVTSKMLGNEIEGKVFKGGLVRGAKVETDALTVGPQVQTETYMTLWESNFNANTTGWAGILGTIARVTTPVYEGAGSLRITYTYPNKMVAAGGLAIPAQVGDVISAWVRSPSAEGYAYIAYYQQQGDGVRHYVGNSKPLPANTWVQLENPVSMPGIIEGLEVVFDETVGSLVYVDLVQVLRPQTSIGAARFTISDGGAALLTAGSKSIVVEDLIDAALRPAPQMGYHQHSAGIANGAAASGTITFPQPFASPPIVVGTSRSERLNLQINQATATGFTWFLRNDSGATTLQADSGFQWIAMN